jgi:xylulokinase
VYTLGLDIGSSSVKAALLDVASGRCVAAAAYPAEEMPILTPAPSFAEQHPQEWWKNCVLATRQVLSMVSASGGDVLAVGIAYQMHGLVCVDAQGRVLRPAIIWCDGRAVSIGQAAAEALGRTFCSTHLLNSPGNFTASKLKWVKEHEAQVYAATHKIMWPGDYIAYRLTGEIGTTRSALSEGMLWDFSRRSLAHEVLDHYGIDHALVPDAVGNFSDRGNLTEAAAEEMGLSVNTMVAYLAGDQPNNAFALNVMRPGEVAATAGTSGVIYAVTENAVADIEAGVNVFLHVEEPASKPRQGVLMCLNGSGILNSWVRREVGQSTTSYAEMDQLAQGVAVGSDGLSVLPFGNGAERIFQDRELGCSFHGINFNVHRSMHIYRALQEGIANSFAFGLRIMQQKFGVAPARIKAGRVNMFRSPIFCRTLATLCQAEIELYETDGALGAARGAALGSGAYRRMEDAFAGMERKHVVGPDTLRAEQYQAQYERWAAHLSH